MKEEDFIRKNIGIWSSLEDKVKNFSRGKQKNYTKEEIDELINLYNQVMNHLVFSRTNYGENDTTEYLNKLASSAYSIIYSKSRNEIKSLLAFFFTGFPKVFRKNFRYFLVSSLIFILAALAVFLLTAYNPDNSYVFLPQNIVENIRDESTPPSPEEVSPILESSFITTNNIKVAFTAFALGLTLGAGTVYIMALNGIMLGCLAGIMFTKSQSLFFWSLILPHGIPELFAIFVCGAAGLIIGYSLINPGKMSRKDALITRGREAIQLVIGCIPILVIAGTIEGYFTPLPIDYIYKYLFSLLILILLIIYLVLPGKEKKQI